MTTLLLGEFSGGEVSGGTSNPQTRNLASGELQLEAFLFLFLFFCYSIFSDIPTIASSNLSWAEILDRLVHFSTIV